MTASDEIYQRLSQHKISIHEETSTWRVQNLKQFVYDAFAAYSMHSWEKKHHNALLLFRHFGCNDFNVGTIAWYNDRCTGTWERCLEKYHHAHEKTYHAKPDWWLDANEKLKLKPKIEKQK